MDQKPPETEQKSSFEIKPLQKEQIPAIGNVFAEAFNTANVGEQWTNESAERLMNDWYEKQPDLFFTAVNEGEVVGGTVAGIKPWWDGNHLVDAEIFVLPAFQKRGIAKKLLKRLLEEGIRKYNIVELEGIADTETEFPLRWYQELGIEKTRWGHIAGNASEILGKLK